MPPSCRGHRRVLAACLALAALALVGCPQAGGPSVQGTLVWNGKEYKAPFGDFVEITFVTTDPDGAAVSYPAAFEPATGNFTFPGGLPPGKYQVRVKHEDADRQADRFRNTFAESSPLSYEVTLEPSQNLVIDIGGRSVMRK